MKLPLITGAILALIMNYSGFATDTAKPEAAATAAEAPKPEAPKAEEPKAEEGKKEGKHHGKKRHGKKHNGKKHHGHKHADTSDHTECDHTQTPGEFAKELHPHEHTGPNCDHPSHKDGGTMERPGMKTE